MATRKSAASPAPSHAHGDEPCDDCAEKFRKAQREQNQLETDYIAELAAHAAENGVNVRVAKVSFAGAAVSFIGVTHPAADEDPDSEDADESESDRQLGEAVSGVIRHATHAING